MPEENFRHIVRIVNTDVKGEGVGFSYSNAVLKTLNMDENKQIGYIPETDLKKVEEVILNPSKYNIPSWMFNRRKDFDTGNDKHILTTDLKLQKDNDIKRLRKIKAYRGIRHSLGQPVRGQRTRSNFRRGSAIGVNKKKSKMAPAKAPTTKPTREKGKK
ncbi:30S ribosomal protein S13 [Candidatus Woesearchaeota archaeon]|nr:30S ribosomal protein S13 [Candidatus Woesearchaeota archaeon]